jgi:hypothetical protein
VTLKIGLGHPKSNQVMTIDNKTFMPNYIKIRPIVFSELRSQEVYDASANANARAAGGFKNVNAFSARITGVFLFKFGTL